MSNTQSATTVRDARRDAVRATLVAAAWQLAGAYGLTGLTLRDLAKHAGTTTPTVYAYFDSKSAIYDAMYRHGFEQMRDRWDDLARRHPELDAERPAAFLALAATEFVDFASEQPARYQLLFQRIVPGFEPSTESYAIAQQALEQMRGWLRRAGIEDERSLDLWRSLLLGLAGEQLANDPAGHRWRDLAGAAARYFVEFTQAHRGETP